MYQVKKNIRICVAYRQPGTNIDDFIETVVKVFDNSCDSKNVLPLW